MRTLILSAEDDTGGVAIALAKALNQHTDWEARECHRTQNYIDYPTDILWAPGTPRPAELDYLFREADVIHVMERWDAVDHFPDWRRKPLVMHHHGTIFRELNTGPLIQSVREFRAYGIVATIDLTLIDPTLEWLPNPCDIERMRKIRSEFFGPHDVLRVAHSPTNRALKGTDRFILDVEKAGLIADVIEWTNWETCLRRKASADLFYDQFHCGYGLSGIEAMAMGIPVIGGAYDQRILHLIMSRFGNLPFLLANPDNLGAWLEFMKDPVNRKESSEVGTRFVEQYHDEAKVARQLVTIYERAMAMR